MTFTEDLQETAIPQSEVEYVKFSLLTPSAEFWRHKDSLTPVDKYVKGLPLGDWSNTHIRCDLLPLEQQIFISKQREKRLGEELANFQEKLKTVTGVWAHDYQVSVDRWNEKLEFESEYQRIILASLDCGKRVKISQGKHKGKMGVIQSVHSGTMYEPKSFDLQYWVRADNKQVRLERGDFELLREFDRKLNGQIQTKITSGLAISFGWTAQYLPHKTCTRRLWKDTHAQKYVRAYEKGLKIEAWDKDRRYGGKQIGWLKLTRCPYKEPLSQMSLEDLIPEGGMCASVREFVDRYFQGNADQEVWVIWFEFQDLGPGDRLTETSAEAFRLGDKVAPSWSAGRDKRGCVVEVLNRDKLRIKWSDGTEGKVRSDQLTLINDEVTDSWNPAHFGETPRRSEVNGQLTIFWDSSQEPPDPDDFKTLREFEEAWGEWEQGRQIVKAVSKCWSEQIPQGYEFCYKQLRHKGFDHKYAVAVVRKLSGVAK